MVRLFGRRVLGGATAVVLGSLYVIGASVNGVAGTSPVSTSADVSVAKSGAVTVTVTGVWAWKHTACAAGEAVGIAVAWGDKADPGLSVAGRGVGSAKDSSIHVNLAAPCGTASGDTLLGTFGPLTHTYASAAAVPSKVCPVAYSLGANRALLVNGAHVNSFQDPMSSPTVACVTVQVPTAKTHSLLVQRPASAIHAALSNTPVETASGCHGGGPDIACNGSMEGNLRVNPGDPLFGGFHFAVSSSPVTMTFQNARVQYNFVCDNNGLYGSFDLNFPVGTYPVGATTYDVPAGTTGDYPPGGQSDPAVNQATMKAPDVCGGGGYKVNAQSGAGTFKAHLVSSDSSVHITHFQFHYGDHGGTSWSADAQWFPAPQAPDYSCGSVSNKTATSATLNGTTTDATVTTASFALTGPAGTSTSTDSSGSGTNPTAFSVDVTGLSPNTSYSYTVTFNPGSHQQTNTACAFTTSSVSYACAAPTAVSPTSELLGGATDDSRVNGADFKLSATTDNRTVHVGGASPYQSTVDNLLPGTTYTYTVDFLNGASVLGSGATTSAGAPCTFTTPPPNPPTYSCATPIVLSPTHAILGGSTTDTKVKKTEFVIDSAAGIAVAPGQALPGGVYRFDADALNPGTHYSYSVNFEDSSGTVLGTGSASGCAFDTRPVSYLCLSPTNLTTTSATLLASTTDTRIDKVSFTLTGNSTSQNINGSPNGGGIFQGHANGLESSSTYSYIATFSQGATQIATSSNTCTMKTPASPPPHITIAVNKVNDANGNGIYTKSEVAPKAKADVPFKVTVTNTSQVPVVLTSITDQWPSQSPFDVSCTEQFIGIVLQPGESTTCSFKVSGYAPQTGAIINTAIVHGCEVDSHGNAITTDCDTKSSTSKVTVTAVLGTKIVKTPTVLPFTGLPFGVIPAMLLSGLLIGSGILMIAWPQVVRAQRRVKAVRA